MISIYIINIVVSNKFPFGKQGSKFFIGCKESEKVRPLCIICPQMITYKINFDKNRCLYI